MREMMFLETIEMSYDDFHQEFSGYFKRSEPRKAVADYMRGLLSTTKRKNSWQLSETMGTKDPQGFQRLLYEAKWEHEPVLKHLQRLVTAKIGQPMGIGVIDETGYPKKGDKSAGVKRQYCGRLGKIENCQVGVGLAYVTDLGRALIDQCLYIPQDWCEDRERCDEARIPADRRFQTKPQMAERMLMDAWQNGIPIQWVCADTVYGNSSTLREAIAATGRYYVMGITANQRVQRLDASQPKKVAQAIAPLSDHDWQRLGMAWGEQGEQLYDWLALRVTSPTDSLGQQWLLIRRSLQNPDEVYYFLSNAPADMPLTTLVTVALARHQIEQVFEETKSHAGMADYEVRHWHSWHRHMTLVMMAHVWLTLFQLPLIPNLKKTDSATLA